MKTLTITCDGCEDDLTNTGNEIDYRLALLVQRIPLSGNFATQMMKYAPIETDAYFCGMNCLKDWISNQTDKYPWQKRRKK